MSHQYIQSAEEAGPFSEALAHADRLSLDCEAAGFHRYSDRLCLVQVSIGAETFLLDPLGFDLSDLLRAPLEDPSVPVLMHGADFDLRLLSRDLGIRLRGLQDTQIVAGLLGEESLGLASLLESRLGVTLSKKYQRADWAERPLTEGMLEYAAADTAHLEPLMQILLGELGALGRQEWATEEWTAMESVADLTPDPEPQDPVTRVKGARDLTPRQVTALRRALEWRDGIARDRDRAPFRVIGDPPLIEAVASRPRTVDDLVAIKGFPRKLAYSEGRKLLADLDAVVEMADDELVPYPRGRRGPGRPTPEIEALADRLKAVRNERAETLGLPRGTLLANAVVLEIARDHPRDMEALLSINGMRAWKAEVVGEALLEVLAKS